MKSGSATAQSMRLGSALKNLRVSARIKQVDAARHIGGSEGSLLSRFETGTRIPTDRDVMNLCQLYRADLDCTEHLVRLAEQARTPGWWDHEAIPRWFGRYVSSEQAAERALSYSLHIPGLLQTREYTDALALGCAAAAPSDVAESMVVVRTRRQLRLTDRDPLNLHVVIDEAAFRRPMGGPEVMREQVAKLRHVAARPNVEIQVLPFATGEHPGMTGPFTILTFAERALDLVYIERRGGAVYLTEPADVECHEADFGVLSKMALTERETIEWLTTTEQELP